MEDSQIRVFNAIVAFVQDLDVNFGKRYKPVALYNRLLQKTTISDVQSIKRHIAAFNTFFNSNPNYMATQELSNSVKIVYSERVYLDVAHILSKTRSDTESQSQIHKHLAVIYSLLNIDKEESMATLQKMLENTANNDVEFPDTPEGRFLKEIKADLLDSVGDVESDANPMELIVKIMQSGFMQKMAARFKSGEINIGKLISTFTTVMAEASGGSADDVKGLDIQNFLAQTVQMFSQAQQNNINENGNANGLDPSALMGMLGSLTAGAGAGAPAGAGAGLDPNALQGMLNGLAGNGNGNGGAVDPNALMGMLSGLGGAGAGGAGVDPNALMGMLNGLQKK